MQARMHRAERAPDAEELAHPTLPFPLLAKRILHWRITCLSVPSRLPDFDSSARCRGSRSTDSIKSFIPPLLLLRASLPDVKRRSGLSLIVSTYKFRRFYFTFFWKKVCKLEILEVGNTNRIFTFWKYFWSFIRIVIIFRIIDWFCILHLIRYGSWIFIVTKIK